MEEQLVFSKSKHDEINQQLDMDRIPNHIAIIMDGNGRWAQKRHLPRVAGHKQGMQTVKKITIIIEEINISIFFSSRYLFSKNIGSVTELFALIVYLRSLEATINQFKTVPINNPTAHQPSPPFIP